jgi:prepilin-type N-terminal cleavage/methylation domain-containing protein
MALPTVPKNVMIKRDMMRTDPRRGFTLIELLIVIAIIGFLMAAILVAVDPVKRIQDSRDARRYAEVNAILNAILTKQVDDRGRFDGSEDFGGAQIITSQTLAQVLVEDSTGIDCDTPALRPNCPALSTSVANGSACVADVVDDTIDVTEPFLSLIPNYIAELPIDPRGSGIYPDDDDNYLPLGTGNSGYYIQRTAGNRIEIGACYPEQMAEINVKR